MSSTPGTSPAFYPPYGHMIFEWESQTFSGPPAAWVGSLGYNEWREAIVTLLSHVLWPRYRVAHQAWEGDATAQMDALTRADFDLFTTLRPLIDTDAGFGIKHVDLFHVEDEQDVKNDAGTVIKDLNVDASLRKYLVGHADQEQIDDLANGYIPGLNARAGVIDLDLKVDMQRPRPFQTSWMLGIRFSHLRAKSALTPSMISGHCFEMMMGGLAARERALTLGCPAAVDAIGQHAVDAGDRRVFAGVHYPSDNISSWITGFLALPHVGVDSAARDWLWETITKHSRVFRAVEEAIGKGHGAAFEAPMKLLRGIGSGAIQTVQEALREAGSGPTAEAA